MRHHSDGAEVIELNEQTDADDHQEDDGAPEFDPPIGDPFALAVGCDLLKQAPGVPGCWASVRCDCGRAFKVDLLTEGRKPCPGCSVVYSHCLLVGPADDPSVTTEFLDALHGDTDDGDDDQPMDGEPEPADVVEAPQPDDE